VEGIEPCVHESAANPFPGLAVKVLIDVPNPVGKIKFIISSQEVRQRENAEIKAANAKPVKTLFLFTYYAP
jgi:hypothetical protein